MRLVTNSKMLNNTKPKNKKMTLNEFIDMNISNLNTFKNNMNSLHLNDKSKGEWMETYLAWLEWTTDLHDAFWGIERNDE